MRGGTIGLAPFFFSERGLSPRARGNRIAAEPRAQTGGSIPACAGEPLKHRQLHRLLEVYPRVRGGTPARRNRSRADQGLSPRARGNPLFGGVSARRDRSIPACAGEPLEGLPEEMPLPVYPRVRGGTTISSASVARWTGLSPRARGNPAVLKAVPQRNGSIPACAGEPRPFSRLGDDRRVYPRVRGGTSDRSL